MQSRQANTPAIWSTVVSALILPGICGLHLEPGTLQNVSKSSRSWQAARVEPVGPRGQLELRKCGGVAPRIVPLVVRNLGTWGHSEENRMEAGPTGAMLLGVW